jgi:hypothetical protein
MMNLISDLFCHFHGFEVRSVYKPTTNLNLGGLSPGPKKASRRKPEPWRPLTWPQKGKSMTNLNLGGLSPGPKKASRRKPEP